MSIKYFPRLRRTILAALVAVSIAAPASAADLPCSFTQISGGYDELCGIRPDGSAFCMGTGIQAAPPAGTFTAISAGFYHACALRDDATAVCWGLSCHPQSNGPYPPFLVCENAASGIPGGAFTQVSAGGANSCGLRADGSIECWNGEGFFGINSIPPGTFAEVATGSVHVCARTTGGEVKCWGYNQFHAAEPPPVDTVPPIDNFTSVDSGGTAFHNCGLRGGEAVCWGSNGDGESDPLPGLFTQLAVGLYHSCGLRPNGTAECWGDGSHGENLPPPDAFTQITAGYGFTCGLLPDGHVKCWGLDTDGGAGLLECAVCGNGLVATTEDCDDGNIADGDGCSSQCTYICGDNFLAPVEQCDDGNMVDADGCDSNCTPTGCGNGHVAGGEYCDDGNLVDGDGCDSNCTASVCHNGIQTAGEECDDGNLTDDDGCSECRVACPQTPMDGCRTAASASIVLKDDTTQDWRDSLTWKWKKGAATRWFDFTDAADAGFDLCLYRDAGPLAGQIVLRGAGHWSYTGGDPQVLGEDTRGQRYRDVLYSTGGLGALDIRYGEDGRSSIQVKLKSDGMPDNLMPVTTSFTIQLIDQATGSCWSSAFTGGGVHVAGKYSAQIP